MATRYSPIHYSARIHKDAFVHPQALIGPSVVIGPGVVVEAGAAIGDCTRVRAPEFQEPGAAQEMLRIPSGVRIGNHCRVECARIGAGASIGDGCHLAAGSEVAAAAKLHDRVHLEPGASVAADAEVRRDCTIGVRSAEQKALCGASVEQGAVVGPGCRVEAGAQVPAGARVLPDLVVLPAAGPGRDAERGAGGRIPSAEELGAAPCAPGVHPTARVHPDAVIDPAATIGAGTVVGAHVTIEADVVGGDDYHLRDPELESSERGIHGGLVVHRSARIGDGARVDGAWVGRGAEIGAGCALGPDTVVAARAKLGERVRLDRGASVAADARVGNDCVFGERSVDDNRYRGRSVEPSARVGDGCTLDAGAQVCWQQDGVPAGTVVAAAAPRDLDVVGVDPTARVLADAFVDPLARVGARTVVGPGVMIEAHVVVGDDCRLSDPAADRAPVLMEGERVDIGPGVSRLLIASGARVGNGTRIDSGMIAADARVGSGCVLASEADVGPRSLIGDRVRFDAGASVAADVWIGDDCTLGERDLLVTNAQGCAVQTGATVGAGCTIEPDVQLEPGARVPLNTVVGRAAPPKAGYTLTERGAPVPAPESVAADLGGERGGAEALGPDGSLPAGARRLPSGAAAPLRPATAPAAAAGGREFPAPRR